MVDIEALEHERERIYNENKEYDRSALKRKILTEAILRDDESVRFYTGLPDLAHFNVVFWRHSSKCTGHEILGQAKVSHLSLPEG